MAGAAGNGGQRLKLDLVRKSEGHCCWDAVDNAAIDAHPLIIGLDAGHKATGLIIAAGLRTAQRAARSVASEISENCIAPKYRRRCRRRSTGVAERKPAPANPPRWPTRQAAQLRPRLRVKAFSSDPPWRDATIAHTRRPLLLNYSTAR